MKRSSYLLEGAAAVAILAILLSVTIPRFYRSQTAAIEKRVMHDIRPLVDSLHAYLVPYAWEATDIYLPVITLQQELANESFARNATGFGTALGPGMNLLFITHLEDFEEAFETMSDKTLERELDFFTGSNLEHPAFMIVLAEAKYRGNDNQDFREEAIRTAIAVPWPYWSSSWEPGSYQIYYNQYYDLEAQTTSFLTSGADVRKDPLISMYYHPSNGIDSAGFIYYDTAGNSSLDGRE